MKRLRILLIILVVSLVSIVILGAIPGTLSACPIDIKPWSNPNSINLRSNGVVPVAILGEAGFDPCTKVDPATVLFEGAAPVHFACEDVNSDGIMDMIFHFRVRDTGLTSSSTTGTLTWAGGSASDSVRIVGGGRG
jgi:hypothetical protein